eukprot:Skav201222  [mRNA]  locus=scaffold651:551411:558190:- [translate_table: standard]
MVANDGIDNTCPPEKGCNAHVQYCMDCDKCAAYRDSLPPQQQKYWPCGYCPTGRGGHCERRVFCSVADDGVNKGCRILYRSSATTYAGCFKHKDCKQGDFCWNWKACQAEDTAHSGSSTTHGTPKAVDQLQDGFCNTISTCNTRRSIDGKCHGAKACNSHHECGHGLYCVSWPVCHQRSPDLCGPQPVHRSWDSWSETGAASALPASGDPLRGWDGGMVVHCNVGF